MNKVIITCAVTGAETTRQHNSNLPVTPQEIADAALDAYLAGASILHLHVRDDNGQPTQDKSVFKDVIDRVHEKCDMIIEVTTGGAVGMNLEERLQPLQLNPEMASLDCGTVNFDDEYLLNTLPMIKNTATEMLRRKIRPTLECFDISHIDASKMLIREGLITPPLHYGLVLNIPGGVYYVADTLGAFVKRLPPRSYWTSVGVGRKASLKAIYGAIVYNGNVHVGFEDIVYYEKGVLAKSNAQLVEQAVRIIRNAGRLPLWNM